MNDVAFPAAAPGRFSTGGRAGGAFARGVAPESMQEPGGRGALSEAR